MREREGNERPGERAARLALVVCGVALGAGAALHARSVEASIDAARAFAERFDVATRRPLEAESLALVASPSDASAIVGFVSTNDVLGSVSLGRLSDVERDAWLALLPRMDDEILDASALLRDSMRSHPAWPWDRAFLGMLDYAAVRRSGTPSPRWAPLLESARRDAPGDRHIPAFLASAYLESWPRLTTGEREAARESMRLALFDREFASQAIPFLFEQIGHPATYGMLPDDPGILAVALAVEAEEEDVEGTSILWTRQREAEWTARAEALDAIRERSAKNDRQGLRAACRNWFVSRDPYVFDTTAGLAQALDVLELCPPVRGSWPGDARLKTIAFVRDRVARPSDAAPVARHVSSLRGAPSPLVAWARLAQGDAAGAMGAFRDAGGIGTFEWTPFLVDAADEALSRRDVDAARAALALLSPAAREECEARRLADAMSGTQDDRGPIRGANDTTVILCLEPGAGAIVRLRVESSGAGFATWGWNRGIEGGTKVAPGVQELIIPTGARTGLQSLNLSTVTGPRVRVVSAGIERSES